MVWPERPPELEAPVLVFGFEMEDLRFFCDVVLVLGSSL